MTFVKTLKFIIPSFLLLMTLESAAGDFDFSWKISVGLALIAIGSPLLSLSFGRQPKEKYRFLAIVISSLTIASYLIFLLALRDDGFKHFCAIIFSFTFMLTLASINMFFGYYQCQKEKMARAKFPSLAFNFIKGAILVSVFLWTVGSYGLYLDLNLPTHLIMLAILLNTAFSTYCLLKISSIFQKMSLFSASQQIRERNAERTMKQAPWFYSFLLGWIMVELTWAISFWPANQLTVGAIILANYYIFWNMLKDHLNGALNRKSIFLNILFLTVIIAFLLLSSKWEIK